MLTHVPEEFTQFYTHNVLYVFIYLFKKMWIMMISASDKSVVL